MPDLLRYHDGGRVGSDLPSAVVDKGQVWRELSQTGAALSGQLGQMADQAAAREGDLAGRDAGARAGAGFVDRRNGEAAAAGRALPDVTPDLATAIATAAEKHGVNSATLGMIAGLESAGGRNAGKNPKSSATGPFQFTADTAKQYGLADPNDVAASADAAARLLADNTATLRKRLGRDPTPGELYLAHQQGAEGAAKLLANPDASAVSLLGKNAVLNNGGTADMSAASFAALWLRRADGNVPPPLANGTQTLSTLPLQLRHDGTIRGEAFDAAATRTYGWRLQAGLTQDLAQAALANQDDPQGYEAAIGKIRDSYITQSGLGDPGVRDVFEQTFTERVASDRLQLAARQEAKLRASETQAAQDGIASMRSDIERQAYNLGANPQGDVVIGKQLDRQLAAIDGAVAAGTITPDAGSTAKTQAIEAVARGRVYGVFEALPTPAQQEAFATGLMDQWSKGEGPLAKLSFAQVKAMSAELYASARAATNADTAQMKVSAAKYEQLAKDDVASLEATGKGLDWSKMGTDVTTVQQLLGPDKAAKWSADRDAARLTFEATNGMELETTGELEQRIAALKPTGGGPGFAGQQQAYEAALKKRDDILAERQRDPLGQAKRGGLVTLDPIDLSTPEAAQKTLAARASEAQTVANTYATPLTLFRPEEAQALTNVLTDHPELLPRVASDLQAGLGELAPKALSELSEPGPAIAHGLGLSLATGDNSVMADISRVLTGRKTKTLTAKMPGADELATTGGQILGPALGLNDRTRAAVLDTAALLFENDANRMGFDPAGIKKPDSPAAAAYQRAIDRALGAHTVGGVQYGGMASVNGRSIVAPSFLPADAPEQLVQNFRESDFAFLPPVASGNGLPVTAAQLRGAQLVAVGDGYYRVALGDPDGLDPQWVTGTDGDYWTLDMKALETLHRTPDYQVATGKQGFLERLRAQAGGMSSP